MKTLILSALLFSAPNFAKADNGVCEKFLDCATFSLIGTSDEKGPIVRNVILADNGPMSVKLIFSRTRNGQQFYADEIPLYFEESGTFFAAREVGKPRAVGSCREKICTMSAGPVETSLGLLVQVMKLTFTPASLSFDKLNISADFTTNLLHADFAKR